MNKKHDIQTISVVHPICCGLDVHKKIISVCLMFTDNQGLEKSIFQEYSTFTDDLIKLRQWLLEHDCPVVAMESTGIYWRPIHNVLEEVVQVILVNARHVKNVPGRKTDIEDSRWLAGLLRHGLVKGSFIPAKHVRQWRDLARYRSKHVKTLGDYKRRTQKLFESANIKIDSVLSDLFGATGRRLMDLLIHEDKTKITLEQIRDMAYGKAKSKAPELLRSIQGYLSPEHIFLLRSMLRSIEFHEKEIHSIDDRLTHLMADQASVIKELDQIPGINEVAARGILSEIGDCLDEFPTAGNLASWAGLCPGNNESAGKRKSGRSAVRKHYLKTIIVEVAWAAVKKKDSYYKDKFYRLKSRRGAKKAIVAIGHRILKAVFHVVKFGHSFQDLGPQYLLELNRSAKWRYLKKQAALLGMELTPIEASLG